MKTRYPVIAALLFFLLPRVAAQDATRIDFRLDADLARFHGGDSLTYVEVYYGVSEAALTYRRDSTGLRGGIDMEILVSRGGEEVYSRRWSIPRVLSDSGDTAPARNILSLETLGLREGVYTVELHGHDAVDTARADGVRFQLPVEVYTGTGERLSDIQLSSHIRSSGTKESLFYKNTLEVIPNPARLYGAGLPVLYFYAEVYNLLAAGGGEDVIFRASILDQSGRDNASETKTKTRANNSSVEYGSMDVSSLPPGSYLFRIELLDTAASPGRVLASSEKKFFVYNPDIPPAPPAGQTGETDNIFAFMTEPEADREIECLRYITTDNERKQISGLGDLPGKKNFLRAFWKRRELDASLSGSVGRDEYLARVAYASETYRERNREGWKTDRGRVSILYGKPDEIQRFPSPSESVPYEIWEFNAIQGGVIFVFVDKMGFGAYRLVHSTHLNELRNDHWYEEEARIR